MLASGEQINVSQADDFTRTRRYGWDEYPVVINWISFRQEDNMIRYNGPCLRDTVDVPAHALRRIT